MDYELAKQLKDAGFPIVRAIAFQVTHDTGNIFRYLVAGEHWYNRPGHCAQPVAMLAMPAER
jgi:hypothetical protein